VKVAIVHRSNTAARALELAVRNHGAYELAWVTSSAADVVQRSREQPADLILVDAGIREPTASELTRQIVALQAAAILLVATAGERSLSEVYEAMGAGALDVVAAPSLDARGGLQEAQPLLAKLTTVSRIIRRGASGRVPVQRAALPPLVAIGASTGGPQALHRILCSLPRPFRGALLIVQHVDQEFAAGLATWLEQGSGIKVELGARGHRPAAGTAILAASDGHLVMTADGTLAYSDEPRNVSYKPSVDALFHSLAEHWPLRATAVLLTGMGRDGALGMQRLRGAGWRTIAQDEASSVVFGMPKAAIQLGAAEKVVPVNDIARAIAMAVGQD
jgi:chemotaxis response regulator CheB